AVVTRDVRTVGVDVGHVYAANTVGAIAGATLAGFAAIPVLGVHGSLTVASAANLTLAAVLVVTTAGATARRWLGAGAAAVAAFGALRLRAWDADVMASGPAVYARSYGATTEQFRQQLRRQTVLSYRDGVSGTVSVHKVGDNIVLRVNGKTD